MTRRLRRLALPLLLPAGLLLAGCDTLQARLDVRTVCLTVADQPLPGVPLSGTLDTDVTFDIGQDIPGLFEEGITYRLALTSLELSAGSSSPAVDLGGIDSLTVSAVAPAGSSLEEPTLVSYVGGADEHPSAIGGASSSDRDLVPYLEDGKLAFRLVAAGAPPTTDWAADVEACFEVRVDVDYARKL